MTLPLLERVGGADERFHSSALVTLEAGPARIPHRRPEAGEQYRFHFDMTRCIGCKCCEVACSEQNNNPAHIRWRRVGEIEAGQFPLTQRFHLSMGCNHCLDAACLKGCPVDAYRKDCATGIVLHDPKTCIGCQYCTWNCPYGVPQYNEERGVVGKCDMCYGRLAENREPACVAACPEQAIRIEIVRIEEWRGSYQTQANAPGMPPAETTVSTTRVTLPAKLESQFETGGDHRVRPEHPHWPLIFMLVLTQISVGAFFTLFVTGNPSSMKWAAVAALVTGIVALAASTAHLGRPIHAYRALKMWRRSWLSREVLSFALFACAATAYAAGLWFDLALVRLAGLFTCLAGLAGVTSSACIYLVPARPAWNSWTTIAEYFLTAALLGPLLASRLRDYLPLAALLILIVAAAKYVRLTRSSEQEMRQSARLLRRDLARIVQLRFLLLACGTGLALASETEAAAWVALALLGVSEIAGRYLFFVSVVPRNIAASFFHGNREAA
jgi:DMSO reductase iron-sulfur subunit